MRRIRAVAAALFAFAGLGLAGLSSVGGCVALVPEPFEVDACNSDNDCPVDMQCATLGKASTVAMQQYICVPPTCRRGLSCAAGCNCQCNDCKESEFCDINASHMSHDDGSICVPSKCVLMGEDDFTCNEEGCLGC